MNMEQAKHIGPGDHLVCWSRWDESTGKKRVTVEQVVGSKMPPVRFLVRDHVGRAYLVGMDRCKPA